MFDIENAKYLQVGERIRAIEDGVLAGVSYKKGDIATIAWKTEKPHSFLFGIRLKNLSKNQLGIIEKFTKLQKDTSV